jgi:outer membrane protein, heavy metal efflux system
VSAEIRAARAALADSVPVARRPARAALALLLAALAAAGRADGGTPLELGAALALARQNNPGLDAARRRVAEARGDLTQASVLLVENPELDVGVGPRLLDNPGTGRTLALDLGISQRLEVAGQRGHRVDRASSELAATEADSDAAARALDLAVATAFFRTLAATERVQIADQHEALARDLLAISGARFERGATSPLEVNGARIRVAEATRHALRARGELGAARIRLAALLGVADGPLPALAGRLPGRTTTTPAELTEAALERRPEVVAAVRRTEAARAASGLASASAWPDLRVGARYATEEASASILATLAVPLPFFQRHQGERERAQASVSRLEAEERATRLEVTAQVREAWAELDRAARTLALYDDAVRSSLEENLVLLRRTLDAGKIGPAEAIVLQRELLEARVGYLDARAELALADARARTAAGFPLTPPVTGGER